MGPMIWPGVLVIGALFGWLGYRGYRTERSPLGLFFMGISILFLGGLALEIFSLLALIGQ